MQFKWIPALAVLLGAQLALALALDLRSDRLVPRRPETPLVAADLGSADRLEIDGPFDADAADTAGAANPPVGPASAAAPAATADTADTAGASGASSRHPHIELVKQGGGWVMPAHFDAPADAAKVGALLKRLHEVRRGFPIATTGDAADRFAVAEHHYQRRLVVKEGNQVLATVYLGSSTGLRKTDARSAGEHSIYAVDLASYELPTGADAWLDAGLLDPEARAPAEIDLNAAGQPALALKRVGPAWQAEDLPAGRRLDAAQAAALASAIAGLRVDALLGDQPRPEWHQDRPALVLAIKNKEGKTVNWTFSKPDPNGKLVLKSSDRPWYLQLDAADARPLLDAAAPDKLLVAAAPAAPTGQTGPRAAHAPATAASATVAVATQHAQR